MFKTVLFLWNIKTHQRKSSPTVIESEQQDTLSTHKQMHIYTHTFTHTRCKNKKKKVFIGIT